MGQSPKFLPVRFWVGAVGLPAIASVCSLLLWARPALLGMSGVLCAGAVKQGTSSVCCVAPAQG